VHFATSIHEVEGIVGILNHLFFIYFSFIVPQPMYLIATCKRNSFWSLNLKLYAVGLSRNLQKLQQLIKGGTLGACI